MFELSCQVKERSRRRAARVYAACIVAGSLAGCAGSGASRGGGQDPVVFDSVTGEVRVTVHGDLRDVIPQFDVTPGWERFLYGPNDFGKTSLRNPQGMALADTRLLVADQGFPGITAIDLSSGKRTGWPGSENGPRCPVDLCADGSGRVYVADTTRRAVLVYDSTGRWLDNLRPSEDPDHPFRPAAVVCDSRILFIGDIGSQQIARWDMDDRTWLEPWSDDVLAAPTGLCLASDGTLLVVDSLKATLNRVSSHGQSLGQISGPGRAPGRFVRPKHVACTAQGFIVVTDAGKQSVIVFDDAGRFLAEVNEQPTRWAGFTLPAGAMAIPSGTLASVMGDAVVISDAMGRSSLVLLTIESSVARR